MKLETGDILHCKGKSLLSRLILKFTKGQFSHTAIVIIEEGELKIVGAQNNGVSKRKYKQWKKEFNYNYTVSRPIYKGFSKSEIQKRILSKTDVIGYDYFSLIVLQPIFLLTGKWLGNKKRAEKRFYCSEFVGWVYDLPKWYELNPQGLYKFVKNSDKFKTF